MYHVTARGNCRNNIFREDIDYQVYIKYMEEALNYYQDCYKIMCYCLMTNHIHIQIQAKEKPISFFMGRVNSFYAKNFNNKYNLIGHLFQSRYNAEILDKDEYILEVSRYIHLNPVKAKIVDKAEEYNWSSYSMYIGVKEEKLITSNGILSYFRKGEEKELYKEFVSMKSTTNVYNDL